MATPILIKRSSVAGKAPATTDLSLGELAINTVDGKLFLKKSVSGTETVVQVGPLTTSDLTEGSNLYFTTARAQAAVTSVTGNAGTATTATNVAGGANGSIPYQTGAGTTSMLAAGTNGQVLTLASGVPTWAAATGGTGSASSGAGGDAIFSEHDQLMTTSYTIGADTQTTCTISIASPSVIAQSNTYVAGQPVFFTTTGSLPTGLTPNTTYYVSATNLSSSGFEVATTVGGSPITTSGTQSGTHKCGKVKNASTVGPLTIASGATVTVPVGARLTVV